MAREADADAKRLTRARYCSPCASWREESPCPTCGADLLLEDEAVEERDASTRAVGPSKSEFVVALAREVLPSIPGALITSMIAGLVLSYQLLSIGISNMHWPGKILAGFVACVWLLERARAARTKGADLDLLALGGVLVRALYLLTPFLGMLTLHPSAVVAAVFFALLGPLVLAALAGEEPLGDLHPRALAEAFGATVGYGRFAALTTLGLAGMLVALGWDGGDPLWRGPAIGLGGAIAGTAAGLSRRSAEHVPEA